VVGGGPVALRKSQELLRCGAFLHVVAPEWPADFTLLDGDIHLRRSSRSFEPGDLDGVFLVVAATDDTTIQQAVARGAEQRSILCNVVDVNPLCSFYMPAILRRGSLTVSVSTEGKYPLFAVAVRDRIASMLGPQIGPALDRLAEGRAMVRARYPHEPEKRREALERLLTSQAFEQLLGERSEELEEHWEAWKSSLSD